MQKLTRNYKWERSVIVLRIELKKFCHSGQHMPNDRRVKSTGILLNINIFPKNVLFFMNVSTEFLVRNIIFRFVCLNNLMMRMVSFRTYEKIFRLFGSESFLWWGRLWNGIKEHISVTIYELLCKMFWTMDVSFSLSTGFKENEFIRWIKNHDAANWWSKGWQEPVGMMRSVEVGSVIYIFVNCNWVVTRWQ